MEVIIGKPDFNENYNPETEFKELREMCKIQESLKWESEEINLKKDHVSIVAFTESKKDLARLLKFVVGFSLVGDQLVCENIDLNFSIEVQDHNVKRFYAFQSLMELIHIETYSNIGRAILNDEEFKHYTNPNTYKRSIAKKLNWIRKWLNNDIPFATRIVGMAVSEYILFSGLFSIILYFKKMDGNPFPGLIQGNEFIMRDENIHGEFGLKVLRRLNDRPDDSVIYEILKEAVQVELEFVNEAFDNNNINLDGLNRDMVSSYIMFLADSILTRIPSKTNNLNFNTDLTKYLEPYYNVTNKCLYMEEFLGRPVKENPMEVSTTVYKADDGIPIDDLNHSLYELSNFI
jgi:ribonucleoside-diphosphate reductase subunit M2